MSDNVIHAENIVNSPIQQGNDEDPGIRYIKLSPKAYVVGSLIAGLKALTTPQWAALHNALQLASEEALLMNPEGIVWPLGDALDLLGFTVRRDE